MSDVSEGPQSRLRESVSALVDGEADELELRRVLASVDMNDVRNSWRDYHLQRDTLTGVDMRFAAFDISQSIQAAIAQDQLPAAAVGARWWRPLASVAVAASVATIVVVGARSFNSPSSDNIAAVQSQSMANTFASFPALQPVSAPIGGIAVGAQLGASTSPTINAQPAALDPDQFAQQRLQQYLLRHSERAALNNGQGVINFVKVSDLSNAE